MKTKKGILCIILTFVLASVFITNVCAAQNEIFFATDVHQKTSNYDYVLESVSKDADVGLVAMGGDYQVSVSSMNDVIDTWFPDAARVFISGNHDDEYDSYYSTGEAYNNEHFALFVISYEDFKNEEAVDDLESYLNNYNKNDSTKGKPLFVLSHLPLHEQRGDNRSADIYAELLNEAAKEMDIVYLWGHNHTADRTLYFYEKGEELTPEGGSGMTLNFTYLTAGYIKEGYGTCVTVNENDIQFQRYDTYGKYDSMKSVKRLIPAIPPYDCNKEGHKYENKGLNTTAKAVEYTCSECSDIYFERRFGDFNGDCQINADDSRMTLRASIELEEYTHADIIAVDIDRNNKISAADARLILRKSVSLPDTPGITVSWDIFNVDADGKLL